MAILNAPFGRRQVVELVGRQAEPRLQVVGTRGQALGQDTNGALGGAGGNNYTRAESRFYSKLGPQAVSDFRLLYANWYLTAGSGDALGPNGITVESAIELEDANPFAYLGQWDGAPNKLIAAGAAGPLTDRIAIDVEASDFIWVRTGVTVSSGQQWPRGFVASYTGEKAAESTAGTSQILSTGALATPSGGAAANGYGPLAILGVPERPFASALILGDSIADGSGDASTGDGFGNRGFISRALYSVAGVTIPSCKITMASDNPIAQRNHQAWRRHTPWDYCSILINEHGGNQLQNVTADAMLVHLQRIWLQGRRRGMKVVQCTLGPRTTCSGVNKWTSAASQDGFQSGFEPGGKRDVVNGYIRLALAAGEIDAVIDQNSVWEDPAAPGKWVTNGTANYPTSDGTHPSAALHILGANVVASGLERFLF